MRYERLFRRFNMKLLAGLEIWGYLHHFVKIYEECCLTTCLPSGVQSKFFGIKIGDILEINYRFPEIILRRKTKEK